MPTLKDIARVAGVSEGTVSYTLSGKHKKARISDETCARVRNVAKQLGYVQDSIATAMATGKTKVIGFIADNYLTEYTVGIVTGAMRQAAEKSYFIKLLNYEYGITRMDETLDIVRQYRLAGVICRVLDATFLEALTNGLNGLGVPFAIVGNASAPTTGIHVVSDDSAAIASAVDHLATLKHKRIAYITAYPTEIYARKRQTGYEVGMSRNGLEIRPDDIVQAPKVPSLRDPILARLRAPDRPTAIICATDYIALKVYNLAQRVGLRIPEDFSVIGFANLSFSREMEPTLTTVDEPFAAMGKKSVALLIREIETESPMSRDRLVSETIEAPLVVRASTAINPERK